MEAVLLVGVQGAGKSTFCRERFESSHVHLSLDVLRTRRREAILLEACLAAGQPFVVDNTNVTRADRARYVGPAKARGFRVSAYLICTPLAEALRRNALRAGRSAVPAAAVVATLRRFEPPSFDEGLDAIHVVAADDRGETVVAEWRGASDPIA